MDGNYYWTFEKALDSKTCEFILDSAANHYSEVTILNSDGGTRKDERFRKGQSFFNNQQFVYDLIWPHLNTANKNAEWNFEISSAESYQISKYEVGDFYLHIWTVWVLTTQYTKIQKTPTSTIKLVNCLCL